MSTDRNDVMRAVLIAAIAFAAAAIAGTLVSARPAPTPIVIVREGSLALDRCRAELAKALDEQQAEEFWQRGLRQLQLEQEALACLPQGDLL